MAYIILHYLGFVSVPDMGHELGLPVLMHQVCPTTLWALLNILISYHSQY